MFSKRSAAVGIVIGILAMVAVGQVNMTNDYPVGRWMAVPDGAGGFWTFDTRNGLKNIEGGEPKGIHYEFDAKEKVLRKQVISIVQDAGTTPKR